MPHTSINRRRPATAVVLLLLASLVLVACGGSSKSTSSSSNSASASTSTTGETAGVAGGRFTAVRECLQKNGITLPQRAAGQRRTPGQRRGFGAGGFLSGGGGPQLPKGVTRAQYEATLKKCGGGGHFLRSGPAGFNNPAFKQAFAKYAVCLRQNGVDVPAPNTSGKGPVFNTKGLNTGSSQFKTATAKCRSALVGVFRRPPGGGAAYGASGPPGAGAAAPGVEGPGAG